MKVDGEVRMKAYDLFEKMRKECHERKEIIELINKKFGTAGTSLYDWYRGKHIPYGRKGTISNTPDLYYLIGALLGDGCLYRWKNTHNHVILIGDRNFTTKFAELATKCTGKKVKAYIDRTKNIWFVRCNNFALYTTFERCRNLKSLEDMLKGQNRECLVSFIEGFFDAEGCVKIIKEKIRKTPKICLDATNTNFEILEIFRKALKDSLGIDGAYSIQKQSIGKDGFMRKKTYHMRIYRKSDIRKFLENIKTTKLKEEKIAYVEKWLNNGK